MDEEGYDFDVPCRRYEPQPAPSHDPQFALDALPSGDAVCARVRTANAELAKLGKSMTMEWIKAIIAVVMIYIGIRIEISNFSLGLGQLFPTLSTGESVSAVSGPLQYALGAALVMGHFLLQHGSEKFGPWLNRTLNTIGVVSVFLLMIGGMIFLAASVGQSGGEEASVTGVSGDAASPAMGIILAVLFPISLLSNHIMSGVLLRSTRHILAARELECRIRASRDKLDAFDARMKAVGIEDQTIAKMAEAGVLKQRAATEAAAKIGEVTSELSEIHMRRTVETALGEASVVYADMPTVMAKMPLEEMKRLGAYLSGFTPTKIFNTLNPVEARDVY